MSATPRLYVEGDLAEGAEVQLLAEQAHYLSRVLRLSIGASVRVFNGRDGEFNAELADVKKAGASLRIKTLARRQAASPDLWLLFAPLKKTRTDFLIEKAVELGAAELRPVVTERSEAHVVRDHRLQRIAVEAAEQTERLDVPIVREALKLEALLKTWDPFRPLFFCDEAGDEGEKPWGGEAGRAKPMVDVVKQSPAGAAAILTGPEGGFSPAERHWLRGLPYVRPVGLGPRILRAETAALAALTLWQAVSGDWRAGSSARS